MQYVYVLQIEIICFIIRHIQKNIIIIIHSFYKAFKKQYLFTEYNNFSIIIEYI